ncbi:MerR family transcriptional regulator [Rubellimicrobium arenae]|uniref:MerR family transcriptional regulator n=1 Tax=Rubellimicrobium arenae TaxID=2817372 RepID=UPI001B3001EB|nr:MerR family transcriptional regulator [Rubellimicrobium arenae]
MATGAKPVVKSPDAFRTISEVAAFLETPAHVLRFWESKFPQIKPVKRAGGRRYYRPDDIALLGGIKVLLHEQGMTIRGVQKLLRERGPRYVAGLSALPWEGEMAEDLPDDNPDAVIVGPWRNAGSDAADMDEAPQLAVLSDEPEDDDIADDAPAPQTGMLPGAALAATPAPAPGEVTEDCVSRLRAALSRADLDRLRDRAARLAPLVARLRDLRQGTLGQVE